MIFDSHAHYDTDCPYMAPVPHRGTRCDSSMIRLTAEKIASERSSPVEEILDVVKGERCSNNYIDRFVDMKGCVKEHR